MKRDTRDARRRASLATSSNVIPADSQRAAPCCHACVIALSTVVVRFRAVFGGKVAPHGSAPASDERLRVNQFKSSRIQNQGDEPAARIETPLSCAVASYRKMSGMVDIGFGSTTHGTGQCR